jgi:NAD(P)-dependent dehydrogenase (short-subunit alcohol dehydrogenase family)
VHGSDTRPIPGSLESTAAAARDEGADVLVVPADLLDLASIDAAARRALDRFGRVDVVVHNARYVGPGHMDRLLDIPPELLEAQLRANVVAPLVLNQVVIPAMIDQGGGTFIDITSAAAYVDPRRAAGDGGWGVGYGASKAAFHRVAGFVETEHARDGIRCFNVQPGVIATERGAVEMGEFGFGTWGAPPAVVGAVVAWLATSPDADRYRGRTVEAQFVCHELGLLPEWPGPTANPTALAYDTSAEQLRALEAALAAAHSEEDT